MAYAETHLHDCYSLLDAINTPDSVIKKAKELNYSAVAITNHGVLHSIIEFYKAGIKHGVKTIIGIETYESDDMLVPDDSRYHLIILAKNNEGLKALYELSSRAYLDGFYKKPRLDLKTIEPFAKDLIISSACMAGRISKLLSDDKYEEAKDWVLKYKNSFPNFYLEMQHHSCEEQAVLNKLILQLAEETDTPFTVTADAHYLERKDQEAHSIFVQINMGRDVGETYDGCYMKSEEEIHEIMDEQIGYENVCKAIESTAKIAEDCNVDINLKNPNLMPKIKIPKGFKDMNHYYKHLINEGFKKRGLTKLPKAELQIYIDRIQNEYGTLEFLDYIDYFVMIYMLTEKAKERNIPLGYSRGSGGNCESLYNLGVTEIDSLRWGLDFSRFATRGRKSVADFDMDMSKKRRKEMIDISKELFNDYEDSLRTQVAPICTFNRLSTKVAIRDIGKVLQANGTYPDLNYSIRDIIAKQIKVIKSIDDNGEEIEEEIRLKDTIEDNVKLQQYSEKFPLLFKYVIQLEGFPKSRGKHAAGVVISPNPIIEYAPLCLDKEGQPMVQFEMHGVLDDLHLIKLDFLGLKTLDVIDDALKMANLTWKDVDVNTLDLNDQKVYETVYKPGNCAGIFQAESFEAARMIVEAETDNIETVIAVSASNRPGTKDLFPDYIKNKLHPEQMVLIHEDLRKITANSCGVLLYQEHALSIFRLANFPDDEVDLARRAIGHKEKATMLLLESKLRDEVTDERHYGLRQRGWTEEQIDTVWALLVKQSEYSFNRGHSVAYGLLSYVTAWLKTYYPKEFMAALLNSEIGNYSKLTKYINECKKMGIQVLEPSINHSDMEFAIDGETIVFGIGMIKGLGESSVTPIMEARPFTSFPDFIERCKVDKGAIIALIKSGAFNEFEVDKIALLNQYCKMNYSPNTYKEVVGLKSKKEMFALGLVKDEIDWKNKELCLLRLNSYNKQKYDTNEAKKYKKHSEEFESKYMIGDLADWQMESLSIYLTFNPYESLSSILVPYAEIEEGEGLIVGTIVNIQAKTDKNGGRFCYVSILNHEGDIIEVVAWASCYSLYQDIIKKGSKIITKGKKKADGSFSMNEVKSISQWECEVKARQLNNNVIYRDFK
jgi:DNA polymerase-3 subunit alpha